MRLAMKLQSHSHPYAATYAMRSQARWQNARMKLRHPLAIIKYYAEAHVEEMGRGEPFGADLDAALSISALSEGMMAMATRPQTLGSFTGTSPSGAMGACARPPLSPLLRRSTMRRFGGIGGGRSAHHPLRSASS